MSDFEKLVRPFETGETTPARTIFAPGQPVVPNVTLRIGRGSSSSPKTINTSDTASASAYCKRYESERRQ